jgi:hypothetical protein
LRDDGSALLTLDRYSKERGKIEMAKNTVAKGTKRRLRPIDVPQKVIDMLAAAHGIDEWEAADLVVSLSDELRNAPTDER